jgi:hypothetical protein
MVCPELGQAVQQYTEDYIMPLLKELESSREQEMKGCLGTLWKSCMEGYSGDWDVSTKEGLEGFLDMATVAESLAQHLGYRITARGEVVEWRAPGHERAN